jgi:hypothetical protein
MYKNLIYGKFYNLEVYMHPKLCMHEQIFDVITTVIKYKFETFKTFIHPFQKIMMNAKCNS